MKLGRSTFPVPVAKPEGPELASQRLQQGPAVVDRGGGVPWVEKGAYMKNPCQIFQPPEPPEPPDLIPHLPHPPLPLLPQEICRNFKHTGQCRYGDSCKHKHEQGPQAHMASEQDQQADRLDRQMAMLQSLLATITGDTVAALTSAITDHCESIALKAVAQVPHKGKPTTTRQRTPNYLQHLRNKIKTKGSTRAALDMCERRGL